MEDESAIDGVIVGKSVRFPKMISEYGKKNMNDEVTNDEDEKIDFGVKIGNVEFVLEAFFVSYVEKNIKYQISQADASPRDASNSFKDR